MSSHLGKAYVGLMVLAFSARVCSQGTLYYNGKIFTSDTTHPFVSYFAVENGVITCTGDSLTDTVLKAYVLKYDLSSATVIPGIVDSHIHFIDGALSMIQVSYNDVVDRPSFFERIRQTKDRLLDGMYVARDLGYGPFDQVRSPRLVMDSIFSEIPAIFFLKSGHAVIANSSALARFGFTAETHIDHGTIEVDSAGSMTGYLFENAAMEANKFIGSYYSSQTIVKAIDQLQQKALGYGITTIGDNTFSPYYFKIYQEMQKKGLLKLRVRARSYGRIPQTESLMSGMGKKKLGFIGTAVDDSRVKYHAMKYFEDMSLSIPEKNTVPRNPGGDVFLNKDDLKEIFLLRPNTTFAFHVQGKEGLENILATADLYHSRFPSHRNILDHAGYSSEGQMKKAEELGFAVTIIAGQLYDYEGLARFYRSQSLKGAIPFEEQDLLNTRVKYSNAHGALTSDFPYGIDTTFAEYPEIDGLNPFPLMAVNVGGMYPNGIGIRGIQNKTISLRDALIAYTYNGAYVLGEESRIGKISPGYAADFAVLNEDPFGVLPSALYKQQVERTFINGEEVFNRGLSSVIDTLNQFDNVLPSDYALSPIIGYDPSLGTILGGAVFVYPLKTPGILMDAQLQVITSGMLSLSSTYSYIEWFKNTDLIVSGSYSNYPQYYFGEGDSTKAERYVNVYAHRFSFSPELTGTILPHVKYSISADIRGAQQTKVTDKDDHTISRSVIPDGTRFAIGTSVQYDTRNSVSNTKNGVFGKLSARVLTGGNNAVQFGGEVRSFSYFYNSNYILAARCIVGISVGNPDYLFRYSLGGASVLRGFFENRFRGKDFIAGQLETRFPLYSRFSGVLFADAGDIADDRFNKYLSTIGVGIRFSLNENVKLRVDYGKAHDQSGVFFTFGDAF